MSLTAIRRPNRRRSQYVSRQTENKLYAFCSWNQLEQELALTRRFDKLANTFLAGVLLVCVVLWLLCRHRQ